MLKSISCDTSRHFARDRGQAGVSCYQRPLLRALLLHIDFERAAKLRRRRRMTLSSRGGCDASVTESDGSAATCHILIMAPIPIGARAIDGSWRGRVCASLSRLAPR